MTDTKAGHQADRPIRETDPWRRTGYRAIFGAPLPASAAAERNRTCLVLPYSLLWAAAVSVFGSLRNLRMGETEAGLQKITSRTLPPGKLTSPKAQREQRPAASEVTLPGS